jgi:putative toxin-antitoxin system antitoxin component (TIGR02293 family)
MYKINEDKSNVIMEPLLATYGQSIDNPMATVMMANKGIPSSTFNDVSLLFGRKERLAELLNVSVKTMQRYQKENKRLNPLNSEMVLKFIALFKQGLTVFGLKKAFLNWLNKPAVGLGNIRPFDLLKTSNGIDLVKDELVRIEYGDLA